MNSLGWTWLAIAFQTGLAYSVSLIIYQLGLLLTGHAVTIWTGIAVLLVLVFTYLIMRKPKYQEVKVISLENLVGQGS